MDSSPEAAGLAYLDSALAVIADQALYVERVDWAAVSRRARARATSATSPRDVYASIQQALVELGDGHSFLMAPEDVEAWRSSPALENQASVDVREIEGSVGYVSLGPFDSGNPDACARFADALQTSIERLDQSHLIGWIVDLRANTGGNMWPMLAGIGPLIGDGDCGSFILANREPLTWGYREGVAYAGDDVEQALERSAYRRASGSPVAVLLGRHTLSSGEAIATAFCGLPHARTFGQLTGGYSTCNRAIPLSDGAMLFLTTGVFADRTGRLYPDGIAPMETCAERREDELIACASHWLSQVQRAG